MDPRTAGIQGVRRWQALKIKAAVVPHTVGPVSVDPRVAGIRDCVRRWKALINKGIRGFEALAGP